MLGVSVRDVVRREKSNDPCRSFLLVLCGDGGAQIDVNRTPSRTSCEEVWVHDRQSRDRRNACLRRRVELWSEQTLFWSEWPAAADEVRRVAQLPSQGGLD